VENRVYGWMWVCPNGHKCQYKHCLPENYVFKSQEQDEKKTVAETDDSLLIDKIDQERNSLTSKLTPITKERFEAWLQIRKQKQREARELRI
jgi:ssDNA-binding Zn-finger/Zn-ribbon topoisomerase 1